MRKLSKQDIFTLLSNRFKNDTYTEFSQIPKPYLLKDIELGAKRVAKAIKEREKITIVGDYDVDGVVSSVILAEFFDDMGVSYSLKIPNRFIDGYGISPDIVDNIDTSLVITVDNGISAFEAAKRCKDRNIDLIITDHHTPKGTLPKAFAIINPKQDECSFPYSEMCGAHVAWYFIAAIKNELKIKYDLSKFLDILSIAIIADMMELFDLNRLFLKRGIKLLNSSKRVSILALKERFNKNILQFSDISFLIAPLINSAGRMDDATISYYFLKSKTFDEAMEWLERLIEYNNERKQIEKELFEKSLKQVDKNQKAIVVWGDGWHEGVIGIVASKLSKKFQKPTFVFSVENGIAKGSVRSVGQIDILDLIENTKELLIGYGGHTQAAGVRLKEDNLVTFSHEIYKQSKIIKNEKFIDSDDILGEISPNLIDLELVTIVEMFEPYGQKNPHPYFLIKSATIEYKRVIGRDQNHLKLGIKTNSNSLETLYFNFEEMVNQGDKITFFASVTKSEYNKKIKPQLLIKQILSYK